MPNPKFRVLIPGNPAERIKLAKNIYKKHLADGAASPLNGLGDDNWTDNGDKIALAEDLDTKAKQAKKDLEELYAERDLLLAPVNWLPGTLFSFGLRRTPIRPFFIQQDSRNGVLSSRQYNKV